jgi:diguanylate cyclase (GGDEF)-like protein
VTTERAEFIGEYAKQYQLQFEGKSLEAITLSLGVAVFPADGSTSASILKAVDDALYQAKLVGRGRVMVAKNSISALQNHHE